MAPWQGDAALSRAPSSGWLLPDIEPNPEPADRIAGQSLLGDFALPNPSILSGRSGAFAPLETHSQDFENYLSTCTEPCTNDWSFNHQSGEPSSSPDAPMRISSRLFSEAAPSRIGCCQCISVESASKVVALVCPMPSRALFSKI